MKQRIITGIIMALIFIPVLLCTTMEMFMGVVSLFVLVASYEMVKMFRAKNGLSIGASITIMILTMIMYLTIVLLWYYNRSSIENTIKGYIGINDLQNFFSGYAIAGMIVMLVIGMMLVFVKGFNTDNAGRALLTINYVAIGFGAMAILRMYGRGMLIYLFIVACFTDIFAYTVGMNFGKHKMAPIISPKKSWEGSIGGTVIATVFASVFACKYGAWFSWLDDTAGRTIITEFTNLSKAMEVFVIIGLTLMASIIGQIGDLVASKMKRDNEIKDYGNIFPGHGGVLDRFDSAVYVSLFLVVISTILVIAL